MNSTRTQIEALTKHFMSGLSITNVEAQNVYRIRALPRRIADLKAKGFEFKREWKRDMTGQRYVRYSLARAPR